MKKLIITSIKILWILMPVSASCSQKISLADKMNLKNREIQVNQNSTPRPVDSISAEALNAFQLEMEKLKIDMSKYDLFFLMTSDLFIVTTRYKLRPKGQRGSVAGHPDYEVEIFRKDNRIKSISISR